MKSINFHSNNTMALELAYQLPIMQIMVRKIFSATLQLNHFVNRSYRSFYVLPPLRDVVLKITNQRAQRKIHVLHHVDQHRFPNIYDVPGDRAPMCMHHAIFYQIYYLVLVYILLYYIGAN